MDNWLGPRLEKALKNIIEWKQRNNDRALSPTTAGGEYNYDGSHLWVNVEYIIEDPVVVQVQQVNPTVRSSPILVLTIHSSPKRSTHSIA